MAPTRNLHELIVTEVSRRGFDRFVEYTVFPEGVSVTEAANLLRGRGANKAEFLLVPADLVPNSLTATRIGSQGLGERYVVYIAERDAPGHDSSYG